MKALSLEAQLAIFPVLPGRPWHPNPPTFANGACTSCGSSLSHWHASPTEDQARALAALGTPWARVARLAGALAAAGVESARVGRLARALHAEAGSS